MCYILPAEKLGLLKILGFDKTLKFNQVEFEPRTFKSLQCKYTNHTSNHNNTFSTSGLLAAFIYFDGKPNWINYPYVRGQG